MKHGHPAHLRKRCSHDVHRVHIHRRKTPWTPQILIHKQRFAAVAGGRVPAVLGGAFGTPLVRADRVKLVGRVAASRSSRSGDPSATQLTWFSGATLTDHAGFNEANTQVLSPKRPPHEVRQGGQGPLPFRRDPPGFVGKGATTTLCEPASRRAAAGPTPRPQLRRWRIPASALVTRSG